MVSVHILHITAFDQEWEQEHEPQVRMKHLQHFLVAQKNGVGVPVFFKGKIK